MEKTESLKKRKRVSLEVNLNNKKKKTDREVVNGFEKPHLKKNKNLKKQKVKNLVNDNGPLHSSTPRVANFGKNKTRKIKFSGKKHDLLENGIELKQKVGLKHEAVDNSTHTGNSVFKWMISPTKSSIFFQDVWEQKPFLLSRNKEDFYKDVCNLDDFTHALAHHKMYFSKNIDVTSYIDGVRKTENPIGQARPQTVWDCYKRGRSIRLLNPQTFLPKIAVLTSSLQEYFGCFVGANMYLTPPDSQGFAPHFDDIEAFVLQLEGEKHWKLYAPLCKEEVLPRFSSNNFSQEEIGEPILETVLHAGDLLYFPRGTIHQARCVPGKHSLHLTVSCYQKSSWADLLEKIVPVALQRAIDSDVNYRCGLPLQYFNHFGLVNEEVQSGIRQGMLQKVKSLVAGLANHCPMDAAVDQMAKDFLHEALPPSLTLAERQRSGQPPKAWKSGKTMKKYLVAHPEISLRLLRANILRLVSEDDTLRLYYSTDNSLEYRGEDPIYMEVPVPWAPVIEELVIAFPEFTKLQHLPELEQENGETCGDVLDVVVALWARGLVLFDRVVSRSSV